LFCVSFYCRSSLRRRLRCLRQHPLFRLPDTCRHNPIVRHFYSRQVVRRFRGSDGWRCSRTGFSQSAFPEAEAMQPRKAAILRASLGTEGFRIYASLATNPRESYEDAVGRLATHFGQPASTIFNRTQFTRRQQRSGESVTQYIAALREMASKCEFAAVQLDERVRDQFVAWVSCDRIRERLLQEPANRTLEELVSLAVTIERAMAEAPALSSGSQPSASVGHVFSRRDRPSSPSSSGCGNCGRDGHTARSADCPARGQLCHNCGKSGHFSSKCRSSAVTDRRTSGRTSSRHNGQAESRRRSKSGYRYKNRRSARTNKIDDDMESVTDAVNSVMISSVQICKPGAFKQVRCNLAHVPVDFILDLDAGAQNRRPSAGRRKGGALHRQRHAPHLRFLLRANRSEILLISSKFRRRSENRLSHVDASRRGESSAPKSKSPRSRVEARDTKNHQIDRSLAAKRQTLRGERQGPGAKDAPRRDLSNDTSIAALTREIKILRPKNRRKIDRFRPKIFKVRCDDASNKGERRAWERVRFTKTRDAGPRTNGAITYRAPSYARARSVRTSPFERDISKTARRRRSESTGDR
jgi:hypothetical protein